MAASGIGGCAAKGRVVEADDGGVRGDPQSLFAQSEDRAGREVVAGADRCVGRFVLCGRLLGKVDAEVLVPVRGDASPVADVSVRHR
jgi:hypothetical protein